MIEIGTGTLTLEDVASVVKGGESVRLARAARERMNASRAVVEKAVSEQRVLYGITTGFGTFRDHTISPDQIRELQLNLLRSHQAGLGPEAPREVSRTMLLLRAVSLSYGYSGCRPEIVDALLALLEQDVSPVVPIQGSVGASGDLAPLAHLAAVLVGEGEAWSGDRRMPAGLALRGAGLAPVTLEAKEGLALINGTQFSTAFALLACLEARSVWEAAAAASALSLEVLLGTFVPAREDVQSLRAYPGALETARRLRAYSEGSGVVASHRECKEVHDAYCMRCIPQVLGSAWDALEHVQRQLEIEVNSVNDNPLVLANSGDVVSAGLFHAEPVGMVADYLKIAMAEVGSIAERRIDRLTDGRVSKLPTCLADEPGLQSGYMMAQYAAAALVSENKVLAHPATVDSIPTGQGMEDHVSMAPIAARHAMQVVENTARIVALELLCGCRALEFRRPLEAGIGSERLYAAVRRVAQAPDGDRPLRESTEAVARWVRSHEPQELVEEVLQT